MREGTFGRCVYILDTSPDVLDVIHAVDVTTENAPTFHRSLDPRHAATRRDEP